MQRTYPWPLTGDILAFAAQIIGSRTNQKVRGIGQKPFISRITLNFVDGVSGLGQTMVMALVGQKMGRLLAVATLVVI